MNKLFYLLLIAAGVIAIGSFLMYSIESPHPESQINSMLDQSGMMKNYNTMFKQSLPAGPVSVRDSWKHKSEIDLGLQGPPVNDRCVLSTTTPT